MAKTKTSYIDVQRSAAAKKDMERFSADLEKNVQRINELLKGFQQLRTYQKAQLSLAAASAPGGLGAFNRGTRTREDIRASQTAFLGTSTGKQVAETKALASSLREIQRTERDSLKIAQARALNLRSEIATVGKINTLKDLQAKQELASLRLADARRSKNSIEQTQARRLNSLLADRGDQIKKNLAYQEMASKKTERQIAAEARRRTSQRLFGDGGASLFKIQTGLLFNYAAITQAQQGLTKSLEFSIELDNSLRNLQAITRISDNSLNDLRESLISVSEQTKFTAVEVANAAVILGQAGLSVDQIRKSISAVSLLATATGTDLERAVDIATSTLGVFNMEASQMAEVANTLTEAVNGSKLNIEKLTLGLQYAGNIAAQSGLRYEELTAALGAMANAGIRSGSTLGTGTRQILIALQKPSEEFMMTLDRLGLSLEDVSLKSKGLYGVLQTLKDAGFSSADAIRSFEIRAAAAFKALSGNLEDVRDLELRFRLSDAAMAANETQMRSLANQGKRLGSVLGSVAADGMEPFLLLVRDVTKNLGDFFENLRKNQATLRNTISTITAVVTAFASFKILSLVGGLLISMLPNIRAMVTGLIAWRTAAATAAVANQTFAFSLVTIRAALPVIGLVTTAIAGLVAGITTYRASQRAFESENQRLQNVLDKQRQAYENAQGKAEEYRSQIEVVSGKIQELANRQDFLSSNTDLLASEIDAVRIQFAGMGFDLDTASTSVVGLIGKLVALRRQLAKDYVLNIRIGNNMIGALRSTQIAARTAAINAVNDVDVSQLPAEAAAIVQRLQNTAPDDVAGRSQAVANLETFVSSAAAASVERREIQVPNVPTGAEGTARAGLRANEDARIARAQSQLDTLSNIISSEQQVFSSNAEIRNLDRQQEKNNEEIRDVNFQQNSRNYSQAEDFLRQAENAISQDRRVYQRELSRDPLAAEQIFNSSASERIRRLEGMRDFLLRDSRFAGQRGTELINRYDQAISDLRRDSGEISEASGQVRRRQVQRSQRVLNRDVSLSINQISAADTVQDVNRAASDARVKLRDSYLNRRRELLIGNENTPEDQLPIEVREGLRDLATERRLELDQLDLTTQERIQRIERQASRSGGGGSARAANSRAKFSFNQLIDDFKTRSGLAEGRLDSGAITGEQGVSELQGILAEAKQNLEERTRLIKEMSANTSLTKDAQKELNRLISEHKTLSTFIRDEEKKILEIKEKHGLVQFNLNQSVQEWANKNLSITATLQSGTANVLSATKSGFSNLFKDLSSGAKSSGEAFRNFASSVAQSMQNVVSEMLAVYAMQTLIGAIFGIKSAPGSFGALARSSVGLPVRKAAQGAYVQGSVARDSVPYLLMPGEYVLRKSAVQMMGKQNLDQINSMGNSIRRAAHGGHVGAATRSMSGKPQNLWLVDERSKAPIPGPSDIVAIISDDMAQNGSTGKLVKALASGNY